MKVSGTLLLYHAAAILDLKRAWTRIKIVKMVNGRCRVPLSVMMSNGTVVINIFIIPLLRHFTIFGQENAQNMRR